MIVKQPAGYDTTTFLGRDGGMKRNRVFVGGTVTQDDSLNVAATIIVVQYVRLSVEFQFVVLLDRRIEQGDGWRLGSWLDRSVMLSRNV